MRSYHFKVYFANRLRIQKKSSKLYFGASIAVFRAFV